MIVTKALIRFEQHESVVSVSDTGSVFVFKYDERNQICDWEQFTRREHTEAGDYILQSLPSIHYFVHIRDDD